MMQEKAIPFLETPPKLDGSLAGDVAFDPVGFSNYFDIGWLREAELKHRRVCMLGVTGLLVQEFVTFPMFQNGVTPVDDFFVVPAIGLWQVFFTIGAVEFFSNNFKLSPGLRQRQSSAHLPRSRFPLGRRRRCCKRTCDEIGVL